MQTIHKIGQSFHYLTAVSLTDRPILGAVSGTNKTLLIDAGNSEEHVNYFLQLLKDEGVNPPNIVVLTHWHWDHIFGLSALKDVVSISSSATKKEMEKLVSYSWSDEAIDQRVKDGIEIEFCAKAIKEEFNTHRNINVVLPEITFDGQVEIDLGGVTCIVQHVGGDHAADSVVVYVKEDKILFLGDCIYPLMYAKKTHYTATETLRLLDQLEKFEAEVYIPSHQQPISKQEFQLECNTLRELAKLTLHYFGDAEKIVAAYTQKLQRPLTEDEQELIQQFVDGYEYR